MPRSERLVRLIEIVEDLRLEYQLGEAIAEMEDFLAEAGLEVEPDLTVDEYIATLEHVELYVDGKIEAADLSLTEGLGQVVKKGFKMVFGKLVKIGKRLAHKGAAKYNKWRANRAQDTANKFKARARAHSAKAASTYRKRGTPAGARARKAMHKPPLKRKPVRGHKPTRVSKPVVRKPPGARRSTRASARESVSERVRAFINEHTFARHISSLVEMVEDAGYEMTPPEDATISDFIENLAAFIGDPDSDLTPDERDGLSSELGKLQENLANNAQAKLHGKYKRFRRERHGQTSRGGSWSGKES